MHSQESFRSLKRSYKDTVDAGMLETSSNRASSLAAHQDENHSPDQFGTPQFMKRRKITGDDYNQMTAAQTTASDIKGGNNPNNFNLENSQSTNKYNNNPEATSSFGADTSMSQTNLMSFTQHSEDYGAVAATCSPSVTAEPSKNIDFSFFTRQMLQEQNQNDQEAKSGATNAVKFTQSQIFKKKPYLEIKALQTYTPHISKNKLSDKMGRRDIQFYDLYQLKEPKESVDLLKENAFPCNVDCQELYGDLETNDFNNIYDNEDMVRLQFGKSIAVSLKYQPHSGNIARLVNENLSNANVDYQSLLDKNQGANRSMNNTFAEEDVDLQTLNLQLRNYEREFQKTPEQIVDIFCAVSGQLTKIRDYLEGKQIVTWNELEDMALGKPDDSAEFQVLLATKGYEEIKERRRFLLATPEIVFENNNNINSANTPNQSSSIPSAAAVKTDTEQ